MDEIQSCGEEPYHVDDMKTPSGKVHIGSLRGVIIHDVVHKELLKRDVESVYTYVYNDMDPLNKIPTYLGGERYKEELGKPLFKIESPQKGKNYGEYFAEHFTNDFNALGADPEIIYSSNLYTSGEFDSVIKESLDKVEQIRKIYSEVAGYDKPEEWYPVQVICPKCGKIGTTLVTGWNGESVEFECLEDLVPWAHGCGYSGKVSPLGGNAKLMWKVDWPAHWKVLGVNVEGAGKDHSSAGGSRNMATEICKVFDIKEPFDIPYEFILTKEGSKMSTSKVVGMMSSELVGILPPEIARFFILRTHYNTAILFDPWGETLLDLFDEFDSCAHAYYEGHPDDKDLASFFEASIIRPNFRNPNFLPRFRKVATYVQMPSMDIYKWAAEEKGESLTDNEKTILEERVFYAKKWLKNYAPEKYNFEFKEALPDEITVLTKEQINFLEAVSLELGSAEKNTSGDALQQLLYNSAKNQKSIKVKEAFKAIYISLIGKDYGPRAGWLVEDIGVSRAVSRFQAVTSSFVR